MAQKSHTNISTVALIFVLGLHLILAWDIKSEILKVPVGERCQFIKEKSEIGYKLENASRRLTTEERFSVAVYEYVVQNFRKVSDIETIDNKICFENGVCIDLDDPGAFPPRIRAD